MNLDADIVLPATARISTMLWMFAAMLLVFHAVLIGWLKLGKLGWKVVDYIWLAFALAGLFTAIGQVRIASATVASDQLRQRATSAFDIARSSVDFYATRPGAICRTFERSEYSPPPEDFRKIQQEYDLTCEWMGTFLKSLPSGTSSTVPMDPIQIPNFPPATNEVLQQTRNDLTKEFGTFNQLARQVKEMDARSKHTDAEDILGYITPFLIAVALALRVTKVTGELLLETRPKR